MKKNSNIKIRNRWYKLQKKEESIRVANAQKILGDDIDSKIKAANKMSAKERGDEAFIAELKLDEYQKLLNPQGQYKMMSIVDFCKNNPETPNSVILKTLEKLKYVHTYHFNYNGEKVHWFAQQKPFTYSFIIPEYYSDTNEIILRNDTVLSDEAVETLKETCEKEYRQKAKKIKNIEQIKKDIDNVIKKRIAFANSMIKNDYDKNKVQLDEYERLLNPSGQNQMITPETFYDRNADIGRKIIIDKLKELNCMYLSPSKDYDGKKCYVINPIPPLLDYKLIPFYNENNVLSIEQDTVISFELEKILQKVCDEARNRNVKQ